MKKVMLLALFLFINHWVSSQQWVKTNYYNPTNPAITGIVSLADTLVLSGDNGMCFSTDYGMTWQTVNTNVWLCGVVSSNDTLYNVAYPPSIGVQYSVFPTQQWHILNDGLPSVHSGFSSIFSDGNDVYIGYWSYVYKLNKQLMKWDTLGTGIPGAYPQIRSIYSNADYLFANGTARYSFLNHLWSNDTAGFGAGYAERIDGFGYVIIAADYGRKFHISKNNGDSWIRSFGSDTLLNDVMVHDGKVYVATGHGIKVSEDTCRTWVSMGLDTINCSGIYYSNGFLFAVTHNSINHKVYLYRFEIENHTSINNLSMSDFRIYPNPATDCIFIEQTLSQDKACHIVLCDISGRIVSKVDFDSSINRNTYKINTNFLNKGVYILTIYKTGFLALCKKIVVM